MTPRELRSVRQHALERPGDVNAHLVFSDALLELGDDLGELIAAGLREPEPDVADPLRRRIFGRLFDHADGSIERGFLRAVELHPMRRRDFRRLIGIEEWEGVTTLLLPPRERRRRPLPAADVLALINHPACRMLEEVSGIELSTFLGLCGQARRIRRVALSRLPTWSIHEPLDQVPLRIGCLALRDWEDPPLPFLSWLVTYGRPIFDQLEELEVASTLFDPTIVLRAARSPLCRVASPHCVAERRGAKWHLHLVDPLEWIVPLVERLAPFASSMRLEWSGSPESEDAVRRAAGEIPIEVIRHQVSGDDEAPF